MSTTIYDSPERSREPRLSIDITHKYVWFFEFFRDEMTRVRVPRTELRAVHKAIGDYIADCDRIGVKP